MFSRSSCHFEKLLANYSKMSNKSLYSNNSHHNGHHRRQTLIKAKILRGAGITYTIMVQMIMSVSFSFSLKYILVIYSSCFHFAIF